MNLLRLTVYFVKLKVQQTVSAEHGVNVTMLAFVNAVGATIPPVFVFPRKKKKILS